jgi:hypothetical protein
MKMDEAEKKLLFKRISGRLEIQVIHAKPVFGNVEYLRVCVVVN